MVPCRIFALTTRMGICRATMGANRGSAPPSRVSMDCSWRCSPAGAGACDGAGLGAGGGGGAGPRAGPDVPAKYVPGMYDAQE
jgi:hypothetical protein